MNNCRQCLQPQAVSAGVPFRQLPAAFASMARKALVRRDDAKLPAQRELWAPGVGLHRQTGILTHGSQACESERRQRRERRPPAGRGRGVRRRQLQRPRRGRRGARAGRVAGAAPGDRSADHSGRRAHLQGAGRRAAGRVHRPGRRHARSTCRAGGGGRARPHRRTRRCGSSCAAPSTWARSPSRAPTFWATASTSCRACRSMRRSAACWCRRR